MAHIQQNLTQVPPPPGGKRRLAVYVHAKPTAFFLGGGGRGGEGGNQPGTPAKLAGPDRQSDANESRPHVRLIVHF